MSESHHLDIIIVAKGVQRFKDISNSLNSLSVQSVPVRRASVRNAAFFTTAASSRKASPTGLHGHSIWPIVVLAAVPPAATKLQMCFVGPAYECNTIDHSWNSKIRIISVRWAARDSSTHSAIFHSIGGGGGRKRLNHSHQTALVHPLTIGVAVARNVHSPGHVRGVSSSYVQISNRAPQSRATFRNWKETKRSVLNISCGLEGLERDLLELRMFAGEMLTLYAHCKNVWVKWPIFSYLSCKSSWQLQLR